ncbi:MAG: tripartite tricarboxylate transporter substrate binding protein [Pseudolabrys sp.]|nr:tripartite tricarboxylate transporter substrate binding protein [Pseudolabrys sp.]
MRASRQFIIIIIILAVTILACAPRAAVADGWPARQVNIVLSFASGGVMDFVTRSVAQNLTEQLGQNFVVENKQGGGGVVGAQSVARATADGYTFLVTAIGPIVFRPMMAPEPGFDTDRDFVPVIMLGDTPNAILANPNLGLNTIADLVAYAKRNDNRISIGHPGVGTMGEYCGAMLARKIRVDGNLIAYRGAAAVVTDLLGGQIDIGTPAYGPGAGAVKILAVGSSERVAALPDVPTLKESGVPMQCETWIAIFAPAGVPRGIVNRMNAAINAYLDKTETRAAFAKAGVRVLGGSPERLRDQVIADRVMWKPIVSGARPAAQ